VKPYYADDSVTLYHGDMREIIPQLRLQADLIIADPPYGETSLEWDRWPDGWLKMASTVASTMWCWGSMRMFIDRAAEFANWKISQDIVGYNNEGEPLFADVNVVWEKHNGSGFAADRFRRVHEHVVHWYTGPWSDIRHEVPIVAHDGPYRGTRRAARAGSEHLGANNGHNLPWIDRGTRLMRSVIYARSMKGRAIHPTEKPVDVLVPLIEYACPAGGVLLDPFAGSCSSGVAARLTGRRAVLIEADEQMCERAVRERLLQDVLPFPTTPPAIAPGEERAPS